VDADKRQEIILFPLAFQLYLRATQPPIRWVLGALPLGIKQSEHEAEHWPLYSAEVKNERSYMFTLPYWLSCVIKQYYL